jgi:D-serine deaminase-like pyridoxal phosphate-dependent protein
MDITWILYGYYMDIIWILLHNPCIIYTVPYTQKAPRSVGSDAAGACKIPCAVASHAVKRRLISSCTGVAMGRSRGHTADGRGYAMGVRLQLPKSTETTGENIGIYELQLKNDGPTGTHG